MAADESQKQKWGDRFNGWILRIFEMLDAKIASALNKIIQNSKVKKKVSLEEQNPERESVFFTMKTERLHDLWLLLCDWCSWYSSWSLCDDNVQEFETRCDEVLPFMSKIPSDDVLESLYKLRERLSDQLKTVLDLYDMEFHQKISVVTKGKGQNSYTPSGRLEKVPSGRLLGLVQEETTVVFYTRMPRDTVRLCGKKWETQEGLTWSKHPLQYRKWENRLTWKDQTVWKPALQLELKIFCLWKARWKRSSCNYRQHPVCRGYKSGIKCTCGIHCLYRHADGEK